MHVYQRVRVEVEQCLFLNDGIYFKGPQPAATITLIVPTIHIKKIANLFCSLRRTCTTLWTFITRLRGSRIIRAVLQKSMQLLEQVPLFVNERPIEITLQLLVN